MALSFHAICTRILKNLDPSTMLELKPLILVLVLGLVNPDQVKKFYGRVIEDSCLIQFSSCICTIFTQLDNVMSHE